MAKDRIRAKFGFKDLNVWDEAVAFADHIICTVDHLKDPPFNFRLIDQLESASVSVALNIAEGKGRHSKKEFARFLYIARGSLYETVTLTEIFYRRGWMDRKEQEKIHNDAFSIATKIKALINSLF